jgi:VanZ family protein
VPFKWQPPILVSNGAVSQPDGTIQLLKPGLAQTTTAQPWIERAIEQNSFSIDLRVRSRATGLIGLRQIMTVSRDPYFYNLTVGQLGPHLLVRLRTHTGPIHDVADHNIYEVFRNLGWRDITFSVRAGRMEVMVDGALTFSEEVPSAALRTWNRTYRVTLGNEANGRRPWLGEISRAMVRTDDMVVDYLSDGILELPVAYWSWSMIEPLFPLITPRRSSNSMPGIWAEIRDPLLNFLCFIPLGFMLSVICTHRNRHLIALSVCAGLSFSVEVLQLFLQNHYPSVRDWTMDVSGTVVGVLLAHFFVIKNRTVTKFQEKKINHGDTESRFC